MFPPFDFFINVLLYHQNHPNTTKMVLFFIKITKKLNLYCFYMIIMSYGRVNMNPIELSSASLRNRNDGMLEYRNIGFGKLGKLVIGVLINIWGKHGI